jgi:hypothetical protein
MPGKLQNSHFMLQAITQPEECSALPHPRITAEAAAHFRQLGLVGVSKCRCHEKEKQTMFFLSDSERNHLRDLLLKKSD